MDNRIVTGNSLPVNLSDGFFLCKRILTLQIFLSILVPIEGTYL
jgi:hypothetical protein